MSQPPKYIRDDHPYAPARFLSAHFFVYLPRPLCLASPQEIRVSADIPCRRIRREYYKLLVAKSVVGAGCLPQRGGSSFRKIHFASPIFVKTPYKIRCKRIRSP